MGGKKETSTLSTMKAREIGLVKKIIGLPSDKIRDCLNACSTMGSKIIAITIGAVGYPYFCIR